MTFNFDTFSDDVDKLERQLAELHGIDAAISYLGGLEPKPTPGRHVPNVAAEHYFSMGTTYPFKFTYWWGTDGDSLDPSIPPKVNELLGSGESFVTGRMQDFRNDTLNITSPPSDQFQYMIDGLNNLAGFGLGHVVTNNFGLLEDTLSRWQGTAAHQFADYFYDGFGNMAANQSLLAAYLAAYTAGAKGIVDLAQNSVQNLVSAMLKAVDQQLKNRQDQYDPGGMSFAEFLSLAATIAGLTPLLPGVGEVVGKVITAASTAASYAAGEIPDDGSAEQQQIKVQYTTDFLDQLHSVGGTITSHYASSFETLDSTKISLLQDWVNARIAGPPNQLYPPPLLLTSQSITQDERDFHE